MPSQTLCAWSSRAGLPTRHSAKHSRPGTERVPSEHHHCWVIPDPKGHSVTPVDYCSAVCEVGGSGAPSSLSAPPRTILTAVAWKGLWSACLFSSTSPRISQEHSFPCFWPSEGTMDALASAGSSPRVCRLGVLLKDTVCWPEVKLVWAPQGWPASWARPGLGQTWVLPTLVPSEPGGAAYRTLTG